MEYFRKLPFSRKSPFVFEVTMVSPSFGDSRICGQMLRVACPLPSAFATAIPVEPVSSLEPVAGEEHSTGKGRPAFGSQ